MRGLVKMSKVETLRALIKQRLSAAAEEIFELFERTLAEYEEEICRSKEKKHNLLDSDHRLHTSEIQQLLLGDEEGVPLPILNQEDPPEPEPPHIQEEELWSSQEGEQLQEPEEVDVSTLTSTPVPVKTEEEDGENPQTSQFHENQTAEKRDIEHLKTEADGEDCGGAEPDRDFNPDSHLQPDTPEETSHFSGSDTDDSCDWEENEEPTRGLNPVQDKDVAVSVMNCNTADTSVISSEFATNFEEKKQLKKHRIRTGEKSFSCSVCGKIFGRSSHLRQHSFVHTGEKPLSCSVCGQRFTQSGSLNRHSVVHTGEKPFSCSVCGKRFARNGDLRRHLAVHTRDVPNTVFLGGARGPLHWLALPTVTLHQDEQHAVVRDIGI